MEDGILKIGDGRWKMEYGRLRMEDLFFLVRVYKRGFFV
jgi:hypothetical protein